MHYVVTQDFIKANITPELMKPHVAYIHQLMDQGVVVVSGPFADHRRGGMFILEVQDERAAKELADNDPAVTAGILKNEIRLYNLAFLKALSH